MGILVTFEGCEGVGKSTQIRWLKEACIRAGKDVIVTREPGGSKIAESIRNMILDSSHTEMCDQTEALLYAAARAQHISEVIAPALLAGKLVICDRYIDSTYAYQGYARGLGEAYVSKLNELTVGTYYPDATIFLDFPPDRAFLRKGGAAKNDRLEQQNLDFHRSVYQGYLQLAEKFKDRFIVINAEGEKADTHQKIVDALVKRKIM